MTGYGTWQPFTGSEAIILAVGLLIVTVVLIFLGTRLRRSIGVERPGKAVTTFLVIIWVLAIYTFIFVTKTYSLALHEQAVGVNLPVNPITPITYAAILVTFALIFLLNRGHGARVALSAALFGTAAAPMIFELPFDLIVMFRAYTPDPANVYRFLFFLPLILLEISTFSMLMLSFIARLTKYTLYSLAAMFLVFTIWALFGFHYPSEPLPFSLNVISKILAFVTAITLFIPKNEK
jgi:hypothetical protein